MANQIEATMASKLLFFTILLMYYQCYAQELAPQVDAWKPMALDDLLKDESTEVNLDSLDKTRYHSGLYVGVGYNGYSMGSVDAQGQSFVGLGDDAWMVNFRYFFSDAFAFGVYIAVLKAGSANTTYGIIEYTSANDYTVRDMTDTLSAQSVTVGLSGMLRAKGDTFSPYVLLGLGLTRHDMELKTEESIWPNPYPPNPNPPAIITDYNKIVPSAMLQVGLMIEMGTDFFATWSLSFMSHKNNFDMIDGNDKGYLFGLELGYEF